MWRIPSLRQSKSEKKKEGKQGEWYGSMDSVEEREAKGAESCDGLSSLLTVNYQVFPWSFYPG